MTESQINAAAEQIARKALEKTVPEAIKKTLQFYGVDVENPAAVQQDNHFLRNQRIKSEEQAKLWASTKFRVIAALITTAVVAYVTWTLKP